MATVYERRTPTEGDWDNRRLYPRRRATFPATYQLAGRGALPAYCLDFSGGGIQLLTRESLSHSQPSKVSLTAVLDGRKVVLDAVRCWTVPVPGGDSRYRHGLKLKSISDADWDFLMALSLANGNAKYATGVVSAGQLDEMLGSEKQHSVAEKLAVAGRLEYQPGHRLPLIEYAFDGYTMRKGVPYYRFTVRSRIASAGGNKEFRSAVLVAIETDIVRLVE